MIDLFVSRDLLWKRFARRREARTRAALAARYQHLVAITARRLRKRPEGAPVGMEPEDLAGAGQIGLLRAIDTFDPAKGVQFVTYAVARIRYAMMEEMCEGQWAPRAVQDDANRLRAATAQASARCGGPPSPADLAAVLDADEAEVIRLCVRARLAQMWSLDVPAAGTADGSETAPLGDALADPRADVAGLVLDRARSEALRAAVGRLRPRYAEALRLRYGLDQVRPEGPGDVRPFREIAAQMGVSESRISQLCAAALSALRQRGTLDGWAD